jgi:hypothetical protein
VTFTGEHTRAEYWRRQVERPRPDALKADLGLLCDELRACFGDLGCFPTRSELRAALRWATVLQVWWLHIAWSVRRSFCASWLKAVLGLRALAALRDESQKHCHAARLQSVWGVARLRRPNPAQESVQYVHTLPTLQVRSTIIMSWG